MSLNSPSLHYGNGRYQAAPRVMEQMSLLEHLQTSWQFFFDKNERIPGGQLPMEKIEPAFFTQVDGPHLQVSWLGHSSLLLHIDGYRILTDPLLERRVSPLGPTRFQQELALSGDELPEVDAVIISHDHYDHFNKYSVQLLAAKTQVFIVPIGLGKRLRRWKIPQHKIVELGWWGEYSFADGLTIAATPSKHFSGRGLTDRNHTLWASWVITTPFHRVFFSGDSGYFAGFADIGQKYGPFDMTFIECGAYNERWPDVHMFPEQTVQAHLDLRGNVLQPIHWATFNLSFHPWYEPMERLVAAAERAGLVISTPINGQVTDYHGEIKQHYWWRTLMGL